MKSFDPIYQRALSRKGEEVLAASMPGKPLSQAKLAKIPTDRYLAQMTKCIFKAGFVWRVIDSKWDGFETAFWNFNVNRCAYMSFEDIETLRKDERIIRNPQKIKSVQANATMILELEQEYAEQYKNFSELVARWPDEQFVDLLELLHKRGSRLGKQTAMYFIRFMGRDGYVIGRDGAAALVNAGVIDKPPSSKKSWQQVQAAFNQWREETGYNFSTLSRIMAMSIDA
ncbi:MAG: DNA-3-methyladenine glycosylase I [Gammaproteobacteria bacterium]|jgi:3-methyladenine DNA glycosylase Tag